jgi:flavodoxin
MNLLVPLLASSVIGTTLIAGCSSRTPDVVSGATSVMSSPRHVEAEPDSNVIMILESSENGATAKIARRIAAVLGARLVSSDHVKPEEIRRCSLVGFGSGIFDQRHHSALFALVEQLPELSGKKAFLFSTSGISRQIVLRHRIDDPHTPLRETLQSKGILVVREFNCAGFNDNSFLKLFGGMNKGRPNTADLEEAGLFALELKKAFPRGIPTVRGGLPSIP